MAKLTQEEGQRLVGMTQNDAEARAKSFMQSISDDPSLPEYVSRKQRSRQQTQRNFKWYPTAAELQLPQAAAELREQIRARLAPWLADLRDYDGNRLAVEAKECWKTSQCLTLTANDPGVKYVEGVYYNESSDNEPVYLAFHEHGWVTVDGHIVDLTAERRRVTGECADARYHYEPLNVYTSEEILRFYDTHPKAAKNKGGDISALLSGVLEKISPTPGETLDQLLARVYAYVFEPAQERLIARVTAAGKFHGAE